MLKKVKVVPSGYLLSLSLTFRPSFSDDSWSANLNYAPGKVIRAEGNVPQDTSLLRINVNTPFEGYTDMSLTYTKKPNQDYSSNPTDFEVGLT